MVTTRSIRLIDTPPHRPPSLSDMVQAVDRVTTPVFRLIAPGILGHVPAPTVMKGRDRYGNPYWEIYDPTSKRTLYCVSAAEVDQWIDHLLCGHSVRS